MGLLCLVIAQKMWTIVTFATSPSGTDHVKYLEYLELLFVIHFQVVIRVLDHPIHSRSAKFKQTAQVTMRIMSCNDLLDVILKMLVYSSDRNVRSRVA